jgi:hypothetical protein
VSTQTTNLLKLSHLLGIPLQNWFHKNALEGSEMRPSGAKARISGGHWRHD